MYTNGAKVSDRLMVWVLNAIGKPDQYSDVHIEHSSCVPQKRAQLKGIERHYGLPKIWMPGVWVSGLVQFLVGVFRVKRALFHGTQWLLHFI